MLKQWVLKINYRTRRLKYSLPSVTVRGIQIVFVSGMNSGGIPAPSSTLDSTCSGAAENNSLGLVSALLEVKAR